MKFTIPGTPVPKQRPRLGKHGVYTPKRTQDYERRVATYALAAGVKPQEGPIYMKVDFFLKRRGRGDIDNLLKSVADGLNGRAYFDDVQLKEVRVRLHFGSAEPRTEVEFYTHPEPDGWL